MEQSSARGGWLGIRDRLMEFVSARLRPGTAVVPVVRLSGLIGAVTPLRPGMSLAGVARTLERAFAMKHASAVALVINSPGGSPVQSRQIYLRIRQLAAEKKLPVLAFVEDVAASGDRVGRGASWRRYLPPSYALRRRASIRRRYPSPPAARRRAARHGATAPRVSLT